MMTPRFSLPCASLVLLIAFPVLGCSGSDDDGMCSGPGCDYGMCNSPGLCDDRNDCTQELCDLDGECLEPVPVADGTSCAGGVCDSGACALSGTVLPCIEQGIRNAIAAGGGPYTFSCDGPTTVTTEAVIVIDNDVALDGGGNLVVDGNLNHRVFLVQEGVRAELLGFQVTGGEDPGRAAGGIMNEGTLILEDSSLFMNQSGGLTNAGTATVTNCRVTNNPEGGITNQFRATMELTDSTVSGNAIKGEDLRGTGAGIWSDGILIVTGCTVAGNTAALRGGGIYTSGDSKLVNSTVSGNTAGLRGGGIHGDDSQNRLTLINSTVVGNSAPEGSVLWSEGVSPVTFTNSIVEGDCVGPSEITSNGYNIESPGNTCSLNLPSDRVDVSAQELSLAPLADNGGPTETHELLPSSVAIDVIPELACVDADLQRLTTDQRGQPRPEAGGSMCDVGAFEVQP